MENSASNQNICFKKVDYDLNGLLHYIEIGDIGLPDIQRPFVWPNTKVRDLFDSMFKGFPVGYLLFWSNAGMQNVKVIGTHSEKQHIPNLLIVDGQQRLTSLYAVFKSKSILDNDFKERKIEIGFNPIEGKFAVADAAIRKDPEWISNISVLWTDFKTSYSAIKSFLKNIERHRTLSPEEEANIETNIDRLFDLQKYPFTALEISSTVNEEAVSDIFVRINSQGVKLNQADFILTLLSVFWEEGRKELENFCRLAKNPIAVAGLASPYNHFINPHPGELLRVAIAIGFFRGRLKSVYQILRGKDLETDEYLPNLRDNQFAILKDAQKQVLNLSSWHSFFTCLIGAGFRSSQMINSNVTLMYNYAMYLLGKNKFHLTEYELSKLIGRFFLTTTLTSRYIGSFESSMDTDLKKIKNLTTADDFIRMIEEIIHTNLTNDFWEIGLPDALNSSSARNPQYYAYLASLNKLGAKVLFSDKHISALFDPMIVSNKSLLEKHHLFPRAWLENNNVKEINKINHIANFALVEWPDNLKISDSNPAEYVPIMKKRYTSEQWQVMCYHHALPEDWELMNYEVFLQKRCLLMAKIIRAGFESMK